MSNLDFKRFYRRNLPHIQRPGAILFVTFRLDGSLPIAVIEQWKQEKEWLARLAFNHPQRFESLNPQFQRKWFAKFEHLLDSGSFGPVFLKDPRIAELVSNSLHHRDGKVFRLDCFSIMPDHAAAVFKPLPLVATRDKDLGNLEDELQYHSLSSIMHSLKGYAALQANRILQREGQFWAHESYDHSVRNFDECNRIVAYVLNNPVKAGLVQHWSDWPWSYRRK